MLQVIVGWAWVAIGSLGALLPGVLKYFVGKKTGGKISWPYIFLILALLIQILDIAWRIDHTVTKIAVIVLAFVFFKFAMSIRSKFMKVFFEWWAKIPNPAFRGIGILLLIWGLYLTGVGR